MFLGGPMASLKAGNELLLLRIAVWGRVLTSTLGLALGASILTDTSVLGVADIPADVWTGLTLVVGITYIFFIYKTYLFFELAICNTVKLIQFLLLFLVKKKTIRPILQM
jgi:energy-converting hydrogenase Eha subunit G